MIVNAEKKTLHLQYPTGAEKRRVAMCDVAFDGDLFQKDTGRFDPCVAMAACALSMSAADEMLLRDNLGSMGFGDIQTVAFSNTDSDKIGLCLSSRIRDNILEVAAVLKGTSGNEWYSNFDIGYAAEHTGFAKAADYAEQKLSDYVFTRAIGSEPRFFLTGYSRGGAVANILAKRLCDRWGLDNVSAYTFAAPATTLSRRVSRYGCIFNLVRDEDFFTRVPPEGWGYTKYGRTLSLSDTGDVGERYRELTGEDYIGFDSSAEVDSFLCACMTLAPNVHSYYERRREVGGKRLSLYGFLRCVADMLSENMDETAADVFLSAMVSDYADLLSFLSTGADLNDILTSAGGTPRCSVADSHSPAAYMAALEAFLGRRGF